VDEERVKEINAEISALIPRERALVAENRSRCRTTLSTLSLKHREALTAERNRYAAEGLWWPNYNFVSERAEQALQYVLKRGGKGFSSKRWIAGDKWTGERNFPQELNFVFQVQGGMSVERLFSGRKPQLNISPPADRAWDHPSRGERRRLQRTTANIAIYPIEDGYRTLSVPILLDRPIPDDAVIKKAQLRRCRQGALWRWRLNLYCVLGLRAISPPPGAPCCGIDVGYRARPDGSLRVASVAWENGEIEEVLLPSTWLAEMDRSDDRMAELDLAANEFKAVLRDNSPALLADAADEWRNRFLPAIHPSARSKALGRFVGFWFHSYPHHCPELLSAAVEWSRADKHGRQSWLNWRARLVRRRREHYRVAARQIASRAGAIRLSGSDLTDVARKAKDIKPGHAPPASANRFRAAISQFRQELGRAASAGGCEVSELRSGLRLCHRCGGSPAPPDPSALIWTCAACGASYDQDENTALLLLAQCLSGAREPSTGEPGAGALA
jgi:hypothetical protein